MSEGVQIARAPLGTRVHLAALATLVALSPVSTTRELRAQTVTRPEIRVDALLGRPSIAQLGVGLAAPLGTYVRAAAVVGGGTAWGGADGRDAVGPSGRVDLVGRFLLDPFRQMRIAPYGGAGVSVLYDRANRWRELLVLVFGVEGPVRGNTASALELGLGGGTRIGVVLRRLPKERR